jgi:putative tricarboxylic transport membrane protein
VSELFSWQGLLALVAGGLYGALFGAIPGLSATLAVALFIPIAFFLDPILALPAIIAISALAIFAGDVGTVIVRIPGTPASAAYNDELYRLSRRKGPFYALGVASIPSAVGGLFGTLLLIAGASGLAAVARNFSSFEYFWIAILGLTAGVFAAGGSPLKGLVSLLLGLLFATVGIDPTLGYPRFDFGNPNLLSGLNYIVALIGLFGFSEVLEYLYRGRQGSQGEAVPLRGGAAQQFFVGPTRFMLRRPGLMLRSSVLGTFMGFLPGAGADIAAWVASSVQKVLGRGRGREEDEDEEVALAGTTSNNAAVAGAWIPALALGLPGDTVTAIVLGVFLMKGITPGPMLFEQQLGLVWALYTTFVLANLVLMPACGFLTARLAALILRVPTRLLMSVIAALTVVGAYAINNSAFDVLVMAAMGLLAFFLRRGGFPLAQVVLGMVLGPILEQSFMTSAIKSRWDYSSFVGRPIAIALMLLTAAVIAVALRVRLNRTL